MYLVPSAFIALLATRLVAANVLPSEPSPGTVWTPGKEHTIEWSVDSSAPTVNEDWTNFTIDFMTGDNNKQVKLTTVATGVDARTADNYKWKVPFVDIPAPIYFFMFTSNSGKHFEWTTRFTITGLDGSTVEAPHKDSAEFENKLRTDGSQRIPWGIGKILNDTVEVNAAKAPSQASASASVDLGGHYSSILVENQTYEPPKPSEILNGALSKQQQQQSTSMAPSINSSVGKGFIVAISMISLTAAAAMYF
ncbi:hypothetical protein Unana1_07448 [Umbelopsis nana]